MAKALKYLQGLAGSQDRVKLETEKKFIELLHSRFSDTDTSLFYRFIGECFVNKTDVAARIADNGLFLGALKPKSKTLKVFYQIHNGESVNIENCFIPKFKWVKFGDKVYMPEPLTDKSVDKV